MHNVLAWKLLADRAHFTYLLYAYNTLGREIIIIIISIFQKETEAQRGPMLYSRSPVRVGQVMKKFPGSQTLLGSPAFGPRQNCDTCLAHKLPSGAPPGKEVPGERCLATSTWPVPLQVGRWRGWSLSTHHGPN